MLERATPEDPCTPIVLCERLERIRDRCGLLDGMMAPVTERPEPVREHDRSRIGWLPIAVATLVTLFLVSVITLKGLDNGCEGWAVEQANDLGVASWGYKRSASIWPPGLRCRGVFRDGTRTIERSVVSPWTGS